MSDNLMDRINPINENKECVVLVADGNYVNQAAVTIKSLSENSAGKRLDVVVLHDSVSEEEFTPIAEMRLRDGVSVRFADAGNFMPESQSGFYTENSERITNAAYYRLMLPWILSDEYERALYLDSDMIAVSDISELLDENPGSFLVSAVRDYWGICDCYRKESELRDWRESIGLTELNDYIISATLVFNLPLWRDRFSLDEVLKLASSKEWRQHDQDVVNILCKGEIHFIEPKWGFITACRNAALLPEKLYNEFKEAEKNPSIIHFGGKPKPWNTPYLEYDEIFWQIAERAGVYENLLETVRNYEYRNYIARCLVNEGITFKPTEKGIARYSGRVYMGILENDFFRIRNISVCRGELIIEGSAGCYGIGEDEILSVNMNMGGTGFDAVTLERNHKRRAGISMRVVAFTFKAPLGRVKDDLNISFSVNAGGKFFNVNRLIFDRFAPLAGKISGEYFCAGDVVISSEEDRLIIRKLPSFRRNAYVRKLEQSYAEGLRSAGVSNADKIIRLRAEAIEDIRKKKRPVIVISDRLEAADDNGEAIFRYFRANMADKADSYFVLKKSSIDYDRMAGYGPVIEPGSLEHKNLILIADAVVSSHSDDIYRNPMGDDGIYYRDLLHKPMMIAEHGVSYGKDFHTWFNRSNHMLELFIAASDKEFDDFSSDAYGYSEKQLAITGLPRFDYLKNDTKKLITVMPTWRKQLCVRQNPETGWWDLRNDFEDSTFARTYRDLMNDERLRSAAEKYGYEIRFKLHPSFYGSENRFGFDENVRFTEVCDSYKKVFAESALIVTDYSSVMFDFAYLGKPAVYFQFDMDDIDNRHIFNWSEGYSYVDEGFGEVETTVSGTVDRLIEYMDNGCIIKEEYDRRRKAFFKYNDTDNSKRACQAIMKRIDELRG